MVFRKKTEEEKKGATDLSPKAEFNEIIKQLQLTNQYLAAIHEQNANIYTGLEAIYNEIKTPEQPKGAFGK